MPDEQAELLRALHDEHAPALWRYVVWLTRDPQLAEDVVQETLLRAWRHPRVLDQSETSARAWLFTVARHLVADEYRSARRRREVTSDSVPEVATADHTDAVLDAWLISEALSALSVDHRSVIVYAYYQGMSTVQIANELNIAEGTVKSRLHYALRALRLALEESGVTR